MKFNCFIFSFPDDSHLSTLGDRQIYYLRLLCPNIITFGAEVSWEIMFEVAQVDQNWALARALPQPQQKIRETIVPQHSLSSLLASSSNLTGLDSFFFKKLDSSVSC